ncbi:hypothetical protein H9P43_000623 [Blastocladiella emersonii ATCC 22665]|nr:hypothetical protein H9P43_000623 [Blastocladiella emersonii ATCC 22665]
MDIKVPVNAIEIAALPLPRTEAGSENGAGDVTSTPATVSSTREVILVGGGGGPGSTGLVNKLCMLAWDDESLEPTLKIVKEATFGKNEDAPWSAALHPDGSLIATGVNAPAKSEFNRNCRILSPGETELKESSAFMTIREGDHDYQCTCAFSPDGTLLATGSDEGRLSVLRVPGFVQCDWAPIDLGSKVYNVTFTDDSTQVIATSANALRVYAVKSGEIMLEVVPPAGHTFRAGGKGIGSRFYTLVNQGRKKSFISEWDLTAPSKPLRTTTLASKPAVSFSVRGAVAAVGLADCSLVLLHDMRVAKRHANAHDVPIMSIGISRAKPVVVTASGDGFVRTWRAPEASRSGALVHAAAHLATSPILVAILALLIALWVTWLALPAVVPETDLVSLGIPFVRLVPGAASAAKVGLIADHVPWAREWGLDAFTLG